MIFVVVVVCFHEVVPKIVPSRQLDILYGSSGQIYTEVLTAVTAKTDSGLLDVINIDRHVHMTRRPKIVFWGVTLCSQAAEDVGKQQNKPENL